MDIGSIRNIKAYSTNEEGNYSFDLCDGTVESMPASNILGMSILNADCKKVLVRNTSAYYTVMPAGGE